MAPPFVILHLGLGSFHRAHQAAYLHALHASGDRHWVLIGGNIRPGMDDTLAALLEQGGAYTLETISPQGEHQYQRITALAKVMPFEPDLNAMLAQAAQPQTRIISFTVTEAGYYLDAQHALDAQASDVAADLQAARSSSLSNPVGSTLYGALTAMLRVRMLTHAGPVTLLNCDNLRHNGERVRRGLLRFIELTGDASLLAWVQTHTTCPNAMVDRITPRPTSAVSARVQAATGWTDAAPVMSERFTQWVIEDQFIAGRPRWESVGVQMVASVQAFEEAKIRLLNATHCCIAWAGTLAGYHYIHEGVADPHILCLAHDYMSLDAIPCLAQTGKPCSLDLHAYRDVVLDRFANAALADTNQRVAMDGFSKLPGFIAPTVRECLAQRRSVEAVAMLPALFLAYLQRWHRGELSHPYEDQAMDVVWAHALCAAPDPVQVLAGHAPFWAEAAGDARWLDALRRASVRVAHFVRPVAESS